MGGLKGKPEEELVDILKTMLVEFIQWQMGHQRAPTRAEVRYVVTDAKTLARFLMETGQERKTFVKEITWLLSGLSVRFWVDQGWVADVSDMSPPKEKLN